MSLKYGNSDVMGTGISVSYSYYPKLDGKTNNEKAASAANNQRKSAQSMNVGIPLSGVPVVRWLPLGGAKITLGYEKSDAMSSEFQPKEGGTVAVVLPVGPLSVGYQKKAYAAVATANGTKHSIRMIFTVSHTHQWWLSSFLERVSIRQHNNDGTNTEQETKSLNIAYTVGGLTLGFADAKTSNAAYTAASDDDTRTFSIKTAF